MTHKIFYQGKSFIKKIISKKDFMIYKIFYQGKSFLKKIL